MWIGNVMSGCNQKDECKIINTFVTCKYLGIIFYKFSISTHPIAAFTNFLPFYGFILK